MSRITEIFLVETVAQQALVVQGRATESEIPAAIALGLKKLEEYFQNKSLNASDSPFLRVSGQDSLSLEIMVGIGIPWPDKGSGDIQNYVIPAGKKIFCYCLGDGSELMPVYEEMRGFAAQKGYDASDLCFEYFLNSPEYGLDKLLTKILLILN